MSVEFLSVLRPPVVTTFPGSAAQGDTVVYQPDGRLYTFDGTFWTTGYIPGGYNPLPLNGTEVALWRFDGGITDSSPNGRNLTASTGSAAYAIGPRARKHLQSQYLYILQATNAAFAIAGDLTLEFLGGVMSTNTGVICGNTTNTLTNPSYLLYSDSDGLHFESTGSTGAMSSVLSARLGLENYHYVALTRTVSGGNTVIRWYVDGSLLQTDTFTGNVPTAVAGNVVYVGNSPVGDRCLAFPDYCMGVAIHGSVLSGTAIATRAQLVLPPMYSAAASTASGGSSYAGTSVVDFGAFPGSSQQVITITGQAAIQASSAVQAWIIGATTASHSIDEHYAEPIRVVAGNINPGTGFDIYVECSQGLTTGTFNIGWSWR